MQEKKEFFYIVARNFAFVTWMIDSGVMRTSHTWVHGNSALCHSFVFSLPQRVVEAIITAPAAYAEL